MIPDEEYPRGFAILVALNRLGIPMYAGTVPYAVKQRRRARNRVARASRRANR